MKSKKHRKSVGVGALGLRTTVGGCGSTDEPAPTAEGDATPNPSSEGIRARLMLALVENPNDQELITSLRELDDAEAVAFGLIADRSNVRGVG